MEMVGMMAGKNSHLLSLLNVAENHAEAGPRIESLKHVKDILLLQRERDPALLQEFVAHLPDLQTAPFSSVRKYLAEMIQEIGLKNMEHLSAMLPVLLTLLKDDVPAVVRQSIASGTNLIRNALELVSLQVSYSGKLDKWLEDLWSEMVKFKDAVYPFAFQPGSDGVKLLAVKFVEITILLFTPDSNGSQPPLTQQNTDGKSRSFNISSLVGERPFLDQAMLGQEASKNLGLMLEQLRSPDVTMLQSSVVIVLINSLAAIAKKRPALCGRIMPVLLGFDPNTEAGRGGQVASVLHALKTAFLGILKCTHHGAMPWRDRLLTALRAMNAGEVAEQALRQVDRMLRNAERASRDPRFTKEERSAMSLYGVETVKKRPIVHDNGSSGDIDEMPGKRLRSTLQNLPTVQLPQTTSSTMQDNGPSNGVSSLDGQMNPVQQMITMIGALLAEGERGAESLEILISKIHPDLLADIVIANMQYLPASPPPVSNRVVNLSASTGLQANTSGKVSQATSLSTNISQATASQSIVSQAMPSSSSTSQTSPSTSILNSSAVDVAMPQQVPLDVRRDPRRDPRRMDPRRMAIPVGVSLSSAKAEDTRVKTSSPVVATSVILPVTKSESVSASTVGHVESTLLHLNDSNPMEIKTGNMEEVHDLSPELATPTPVVAGSISVNTGAVELLPLRSATTVESESRMEVDSCAETNLSSSDVSSTTTSEAPMPQLTMVQPYINLTEEQQAFLSKMAFTRIVAAYNQAGTAGGGDLRRALLALLVAQCETGNDAVGVLQKHIVADYQNHKGHDLTLHVLYHLYEQIVSQPKELVSSEVASSVYEKFLLAVAQALRDSLPPSDKSLSKLLGEAPFLPESALTLLEGLCNPGTSDHHEKDMVNGDRVTQGLGAVWSLILLRPLTRNACLNIALQCAVHDLDEVRAKAIRLVANKLYPLDYISQNIEQFATKMLLSVVDAQQVSGGTHDSSASDETCSRINKENVQKKMPNGEESVTEGKAFTIENTAENDSQQVTRHASTVSMAKAQRCMSLYFALCSKKHGLLQKVFIIYGQAPKAVKQAVHRHIPTLVRAIGSSSSELLEIISDPPHGSESILMQVLHILTEGTTPSKDLIETVKQLYETKLKDAGILIPMLSSLSKDEVLPIFPRLVDLPLDKFQNALARILQGSVHTGPALTPAEVLIAIHGIDPEKDVIPLKKITDACSACFEQRTVFTQQVLAKVLNQLVEQTPLPLLFMRTVIQAIGAFPSLVDFVMEILSRLVSKQIWKLPKLWVGFLKCAYQTKPHSFHVLLQLPAPQLENALNRHPTLRAPLASYASQPNVRSTLPRTTLVVLGLAQDNLPVISISSTPQSTDAGASGKMTKDT
ncbi:uncharacterized protein LOC131061569 [Cryptomeria japonica]|uniref:uncharacterized protein LOC131061569 n=1 Tax=Cryptomeria japonica TaxID=3369 RepID=UPI0025AC9336|nr:uncharacterized protein LOC131061569 [Cryptomeria japonica]